MRKILQEFKDFAMKGNVLDLAVGSLSVEPSRKSSARWWKTS
jgi:hypothetical protein